MALKIHHTQHKQAAKLGYELSVDGQLGEYRARDVATKGSKALPDVFGMSITTVIKKCEEARRRQTQDLGDKGYVALPKAKPAPVERDEDDGEDEGDEEAEGEDDAAEADNANAEADAEEEEESAKGSVVKDKYKKIYKPFNDSCGDAMADAFARATKSADDVLNMEAVYRIARANGVDLGRYLSRARGWQGRLRMTLGNILRGKIRNGQDVDVGGTSFQGQNKDKAKAKKAVARGAKIR